MDYLFQAILALASLSLFVWFRKLKGIEKEEKLPELVFVILIAAIGCGIFFLINVIFMTHSPFLFSLGEILLFVSVAGLCLFLKKNSWGILHTIFLTVLIIGIACFAFQRILYASKIVTAEVPTMQREEIQISNMVDGYYAFKMSGEYIYFPAGGEKLEKIPVNHTEPNYVQGEGRLVKVTKTYTVTDNNTNPPTPKEPITQIRYELFVPEGSIQTIK